MAHKPKAELIEPLAQQTIAPLLTRTIVFLGLFVLISGIIGPRVISHGLVNHDGFQIYGGAGKALLFGALCLMLLVQRQPSKPALQNWRPRHLIWLIWSALAGALAWYSITRLIAHDSSEWAVLAHMGLISSIIFVAGAVFGPANLRLIAKIYKQELLISLGLMAVFFIFLTLVYSLWQVLAAAVLHVVSSLLKLSGLQVVQIPPRTLLLNKFGIEIAQYCSGIESIALFTGLYGLIGVLDWQRLRHNRFLWIFPIALAILFAFNILRVYGLIMAGYYINPHIAFSLFHTYAGMVFFIIYATIFWAISYKWMLDKSKA